MTRILQVEKDKIVVTETNDFADGLDLFWSSDDRGWYFHDPNTNETSKIYPSTYAALKDYAVKKNGVIRCTDPKN